MNLNKLINPKSLPSRWHAAAWVIGIVFVVAALSVRAESVATSVTVGNAVPSFTAGPAESVASTATTPTNVGSTVTFTATAEDGNNEDYYLAICKTDAITPGSSSAPTCTGGSWCITGATASGAGTSCGHTAIDGDAEVNAWYAFVCDGTGCSASSQGSGDTGSPFEVNHAPDFSAISNDSTKNPGETITWSATASDTDTSSVADTVKLLVCKTAGITAGACTGDEWCSSSLGASDPTCGYAIPTPTADTTYGAFAYVVDNHNFASDGVAQGSASNYVVNNVAPVVSGVQLNADTNIGLTENTPTSIDVTATVTDNNSCVSTELTSVTASVYRSGVAGGAGCSANNNNCYQTITCVEDVGSCTGATDASATYTCTVSIAHYADPTDASTIYSAENWLTTVTATDDDAAADSLAGTGVEVESLTAMEITESIAYGSLSVGQKNDPLDKTTTITNTGNVGLDQELSGTNMTSGGDSILVQYQKYALAVSTAYASGTSLSGTPTSSLINIPKTTTGTNTTGNTWWGLEIPLGTVAGSYAGTNTVLAVKSDTGSW